MTFRTTTLWKMTVNVTIFRTTILGIMTFSKMTLSKTTLSITTLSIMILNSSTQWVHYYVKLHKYTYDWVRYYKTFFRHGIQTYKLHYKSKLKLI
jgi:hypothetical protein